MGKPDISLYRTSKDYKRLKELLDNGHEVIVLNCPLIGYAQKIEDWYWFGGQTHIESRELLSFCREQSIEFLEPARITRDELGTLKTMAKNFLPNIHETNGGYYTVFDTLIDEEVDLLKKLSEMQL